VEPAAAAVPMLTCVRTQH